MEAIQERQGMVFFDKDMEEVTMKVIDDGQEVSINLTEDYSSQIREYFEESYVDFLIGVSPEFTDEFRGIIKDSLDGNTPVFIYSQFVGEECVNNILNFNSNAGKAQTTFYEFTENWKQAI